VVARRRQCSRSTPAPPLRRRYTGAEQPLLAEPGTARDEPRKFLGALAEGCDHPAMEIWSYDGKLYEITSRYSLPDDAWHYELTDIP
jgi:hypothetical protein